MTALQGEELFSLARPITPSQRPGMTVSVGVRSEPPMDEPLDEWEIRLLGLQELICELLIKNQRLRAALREATSASPTESQAHAV
jgi:hypothetical protein